MAKDSKLWEEAFRASQEVIKVPQYTMVKPAPTKPEFAFGMEDRELKKRLRSLNKQIKELKIEQRIVVQAMKHRELLRHKHGLLPVILYALELEDGCYYVGMTHNVERRFNKHLKGKGAIWTKLHKPIDVIETRVTEFYHQDQVAHLEDDMTLEYAMKYGSDKVRGGGFCQTKPHWPPMIVQNEFNN